MFTRTVSTLILLTAAMSLAGCGNNSGFSRLKDRFARPAAAAPAPRPGEVETGAVIGPTTPELAAPRPPAGAITAEALDTTTEAQKEAATAVVAAAGDTLIGQTIISLGNPAEPGFWLRGGPVKTASQGRVV